MSRDAAGLGWDLRALQRENRLKILYTTREVFRPELQQADSLLIDEANKIGARRIFIDGATSLLPLRQLARYLSRPRAGAAARAIDRHDGDQTQA